MTSEAKSAFSNNAVSISPRQLQLEAAGSDPASRQVAVDPLIRLLPAENPPGPRPDSDRSPGGPGCWEMPQWLQSVLFCSNNWDSNINDSTPQKQPVSTTVQVHSYEPNDSLADIEAQMDVLMLSYKQILHEKLLATTAVTSGQSSSLLTMPPLSSINDAPQLGMMGDIAEPNSATVPQERLAEMEAQMESLMYNFNRLVKEKDDRIAYMSTEVETWLKSLVAANQYELQMRDAKFKQVSAELEARLAEKEEALASARQENLQLSVSLKGKTETCEELHRELDSLKVRLPGDDTTKQYSDVIKLQSEQICDLVSCNAALIERIEHSEGIAQERLAQLKQLECDFDLMRQSTGLEAHKLSDEIKVLQLERSEQSTVIATQAKQLLEAQLACQAAQNQISDLQTECNLAKALTESNCRSFDVKDATITSLHAELTHMSESKRLLASELSDVSTALEESLAKLADSAQRDVELIQLRAVMETQKVELAEAMREMRAGMDGDMAEAMKRFLDSESGHMERLAESEKARGALEARVQQLESTLSVPSQQVYSGQEENRLDETMTEQSSEVVVDHSIELCFDGVPIESSCNDCLDASIGNKDEKQYAADTTDMQPIAAVVVAHLDSAPIDTNLSSVTDNCYYPQLSTSIVLASEADSPLDASNAVSPPSSGENLEMAVSVQLTTKERIIGLLKAAEKSNSSISNKQSTRSMLGSALSTSHESINRNNNGNTHNSASQPQPHRSSGSFKPKGLLQAVMTGDLDKASMILGNKILMASTIDVNLRDSEGCTALMRACEAGYIDIVNDLLTLGKAETNFIDKDRSTALMYAAAAGHAEICEALLKHKADPEKRNSDGYTALMLAVHENYNMIATMLVDCGAATADVLSTPMLASNKQVVEHIRQRQNSQSPTIVVPLKALMQSDDNENGTIKTTEQDRLSYFEIGIQHPQKSAKANAKRRPAVITPEKYSSVDTSGNATLYYEDNILISGDRADLTVTSTTSPASAKKKALNRKLNKKAQVVPFKDLGVV